MFKEGLRDGIEIIGINAPSTRTYTKYKAYTLGNFKKIPQIQALPQDLIRDIEIVGTVLPFKANNYVVDKLIDWDKVPNDPVFILTFSKRHAV
jgi:hypothetical protein